jgi:hypothetical protein
MAASKMNRFFNSPALFAVVCGTYVAIFYITNNLTMLSGTSIAVVFLALSAPPILVALALNLAFRWFNANNFLRFAIVFSGIVFVLVSIRHSIFGIQAVRQWLEVIGGVNSRPAQLAFALFTFAIAGLVGFGSRKDSRVLVSMLLTMMLVALFSNAGKLSNRMLNADSFPGLSASSYNELRLGEKPNIYLLITDSYSSFVFLASIGADTASFKGFLTSTNFRIYEEFFSNYHSTLSAMAAMLNMQHHYYVGSEAQGEITSGGRFTISGNNNFVRHLVKNGYRIHYLHQSAYLTLHGCSVDVETCFPNEPFAGAKSVVNYALPGFLRAQDIWQSLPLIKIDEEIARTLDSMNAEQPNFSYIHVFPPGHVDNFQKKGICNEVEETESYKERVALANDYLEKVIHKILAADPDAVIVLAGDHGPFIANQCDYEVNVDSVAEYRDRLGALLAIRWPGKYDGRYDDRIKSNINVLRYVLASLLKDDSQILNELVAEDAFSLASSGFQRIVKDGEIIIPPETFSNEEMSAMLMSEQRRASP